MQGSFLIFYVHEADRHAGRPVWEWLLDEANRMGVRGGTAFRAMAGFGHHHVLHEARFLELAGQLAIQVEFAVSDAQAQALLDLVHAAQLRLSYACVPASYGIIDPDQDPPALGRAR
ncbi:MAG: DUF190 domain-containing protein [Gammaproteobacteria bacterium]|jgi:PII-like signaling protein|nr:DUF190 domain-containing protein [Gammaproteobacteria bacterium]